MNSAKKHVEVVCALIEKDNKIFCCQRGSKGECAYKWEFPGGKIEPGETKEHAIVREIKEELNADIEVVKYLTTIKHEYNTFSITMHAFICKLNSSLIISEHVDFKWLSVNEMSSVDFAEADKLIIKIIN